jgi:TolA-binding protein
MLMEKLGIASVIISAITALGVWLSARESRKATTTNTTSSSRVEMEKEAYERARALDVQTIERQERRINELEEEADETEIELTQLHTANANLEDRSDRLASENRQLREALHELQLRVTRVQRGMNPESTERIRIRETDTNPILPEAGNGGK